MNWEQKAEQGLKKTTDNACQEIELQEMRFAQPYFNESSEIPQYNQVPKQMVQATMQKLESNQLPDITLPKALGAQREVFVNRKSEIDKINLLQRERDD